YSHALDGISLVVAVGLLMTYAAGLGYDLRHRRGPFAPVTDTHVQEETWSVRTSIALLAVAGAPVGVMRDVPVHSIEGAPREVAGLLVAGAVAAFVQRGGGWRWQVRVVLLAGYGALGVGFVVA